MSQPSAVRYRETRRFTAMEADYVAAAQAAVHEVKGIEADVEERVLLPAGYSNLSDEGAVWVSHVVGQGLVVEFPEMVGLLGQRRSLVYCTEEWTIGELVAWRYDEVDALGDGWFLAYLY
ncbi:MAG: hypothetical protein VB139_08120 [Coriobacteriia bacterium]|nr:hypothetical protein [Coriobacteriia bacterium]